MVKLLHRTYIVVCNAHVTTFKYISSGYIYWCILVCLSLDYLYNYSAIDL